MKIGAKLTAILVLVAMAGIILSALISYVVARKGIIEEIERHLESVVVLKEDHLKKYVEERIGDLDHMTRNKLYREVFLGASKQKIRGVLKETLAHKKELIELFTLNLDGVVDVSTDERQEGKIKSYEKYFIEGKKGPFLQSLYYDLSLQVPSMTISAPIRDEQGGLSGLLVGRVNLKRISSLMTDRTGLGKTGETYLVNLSNFMITESRFEKGLALNKFVSTEGVRDCLKGNSGHRMYVNYMGTPVLGYYEWIPETRACLLAEISEKEAFAPIDRLRNILAFVTIGVVILVIIFGFFFSKTISKPLEKLIRGIERIGKGDLEHRVDVRGKDEIGKLAFAFNHMTERRQEADEMLRKAHDELEQRVEERTSELVREIGERKQVEAALQETEKLYRTLIETSPDAIVLVDMNTNFLMVNQVAVRLYGYQNEEEMIGKTFLNLIVPEERPRLFEHFKDTRQTGSNQILEHTSLKKDGSSFHAAVNASLIFDAQGRPKGIIAITRDMTEHKRAEGEREKLIHELQDALGKIKTLSGLLPICASCKKIRDDEGYWNQIETYIGDHSETEFTHTICPECMKKLYPDFADNKNKEVIKENIK